MANARIEKGPKGEIRFRFPIAGRKRMSVSTPLKWARRADRYNAKEILRKLDGYLGTFSENKHKLLELFPWCDRLHQLPCFAETGASLTVGQLLERYKTHYATEGFKTAKKVGTPMYPIVEAFGNLRASELTWEMIYQWREKRVQQGYAPGTINGNLSVLSGAYRLARIARPDIPFFRVENARKNFFRPEEVQAFLRHLPADTDAQPGANLQNVVKVMFYTGWRVNEVLNLRTEESVNLEDGYLWVADTKNGDGRTFPFGGFPELRECVEAQLRYTREFRVRTRRMGEIPWLFHRHGQRLTYAFFCARWVEAAAAVNRERVDRGLEPIRRIAHDFRRTAARNMRNRGVPTDLVMALMGWHDFKLFRRYAIGNLTDLTLATAKLGEKGRLLPRPAQILPIGSPSNPEGAENSLEIQGNLARRVR